jgi:hypothetical protein
MSSHGFPIILKATALDWHDTLDVQLENGTLEERPLGNAAVLELWFEDRFVLVRYERQRPLNLQRVWLYFDHPDGSNGMTLNRATMRFHWPST